MSFGGFTAAAAKVVLGVEATGFNAGLNAAEQQFARSMAAMGGIQGEMAERSIRAKVAEERLLSTMKKSGHTSIQSRAALASYVGEVRKLTDVQHAAAHSMGRFERGMIAGTARGIGFGRAMAFASNAFLGGAGLVFAIKSATDAAQKFQGEMTLLYTQALAPSTAEVKRMSEAILRVSPRLATGPDALAKAMYRIESAGIRGTKALRLLTTAAKGARIGHSDLEMTTRALVAAQKSGIKGAEDLTQAMATVDAIVGAGDLRLEDLTKALSSGIVPAARQFGISLSEMGAALATLTVQGQPAELSATRLRYSIALLGAQTPKAEAELKKIGLTQSEMGKKMRTEGLIPALELLNQKLKTSGLTIEDQNRILVRAFGGGRSSTTILTLIQNLDMLHERYRLITTEGTKVKFGERFAAQAQTAEFAFAQLGAAIDVIKIRMGNALLPGAVTTAKAMAEWLDSAENQQRLARDVGEAFEYAKKAAEGFGGALGQVRDLLHLTDQVLGGTGKSLKILAGFLILRKALGFARMWNDSILQPLRKTPAAAAEATAAITAADTALAKGGALGMYGTKGPWRDREGDAAVAAGSFIQKGAAEFQAAEKRKQLSLKQTLEEENRLLAAQNKNTKLRQQAADLETKALGKVAVAKKEAEAIHPAQGDVSILDAQTTAINEQTAALVRNAAAKGGAYGGHPAYPMAERYAVGGGRLTPNAVAKALGVSAAEGALLLTQLNQRGVVVPNPARGTKVPVRWTAADAYARFGDQITLAQGEAIAAKANQMFAKNATMQTAAPFLLAQGAAAGEIPAAVFDQRRQRRAHTRPGTRPRRPIPGTGDQGAFATVAPDYSRVPPASFVRRMSPIRPIPRYTPEQLKILQAHAEAEIRATQATKELTAAQKVAREVDELRGKAASSTATALNAQADVEQKVARAGRLKQQQLRSRALDIIAANPQLSPTQALRDYSGKLKLTPAEADALRRELAASGAYSSAGGKVRIAPRPTTASITKEFNTARAQAKQALAYSNERAKVAAAERKAADEAAATSSERVAAAEKEAAAAIEARAKAEADAAAVAQKAAEKRVTSTKKATSTYVSSAKEQAAATKSVTKASEEAAVAQRPLAQIAQTEQRIRSEKKLAAAAKAEADAIKHVTDSQRLSAPLREKNVAYIDRETGAYKRENAAVKTLTKSSRILYGGRTTGKRYLPSYQGAGSMMQGIGGFFGGPEGTNRALAIGMMATLFGDQLPRMLGLGGTGVGSGMSTMLMGAGSGLMFGSMLGVNPWASAAVGGSFGLKHLIGGTAGGIIGNVGEGAAFGALAGTMGGPLSGLTVPMGTLIGAAGGLALSLGKLAFSSESTATKLSRLGDESSKARTGVAVAKRNVFNSELQFANAKVGADQAYAAMKTAEAEERATRGTTAHADAVTRLEAAQMNYRAAADQVVIVEQALDKARADATKKAEHERQVNKQLIEQLMGVASQARKTASANRQLYGGFGTGKTALEEYVKKMMDLSKSMRNSNPRLARVAATLATIALKMKTMPTLAEITVLLNVEVNQRSVAAAKHVFHNLASIAALGGAGGPPKGGMIEAYWDGKQWVSDKTGKPLKDQAAADKRFRKLYPNEKKPHKGWYITVGSDAIGGGNTRPRPTFHAELPQSMVTAELKAEATGNKKKQRAVLRQEKAWLMKQLPHARNDRQRAEIWQQIISINNQLESLKPDKKTGSGGGLLGFLPDNLEDAYDRAVQSGNKKAQLEALQDEAAYIRKYLKAHPKGKLHRKGEAALTMVMKRIHALQKGRGGGTSMSDFIPAPLQIAYQKALRTEGKKDDIKALQAEKNWLVKWLEDPKHKGKAFEKQQLIANKLLTSIDKKLKDLIHKQDEVLRAMEMQFLSELSSFWAQFGSNVFTDQGGYKMPGANSGPMTGGKPGKGGKGGGKIKAESYDGPGVTVVQQFPHPPTSDGHREARMAMHAVRSAFESV